MSLLALAYKRNDGAWADDTSTDSDECVSVIRAVTRRLKKPTMTDGKVKSPLTSTTGVVPPDTDIGNHAPLVETKGLYKTVTAPNSPSVLRHEKWTTVWRKRNEKKEASGNTQMVSKSLNALPKPDAMPKSDSKRETPSGVSEKKNLIASNIIVSKLLESNDPDPKIRHAHDLEKLVKYIRSILPDD
ncbi:unnamed protein product [Schistosoma curassoni]|uniref:BHLH domain-containing protein n=1 Tax=Schistosoma curassoni TaxID=6186 RepID=A0A183L402_9TREM|nr:unnamed protein product [Schistosoma curassoni]